MRKVLVGLMAVGAMAFPSMASAHLPDYNQAMNQAINSPAVFNTCGGSLDGYQCFTYPTSSQWATLAGYDHTLRVRVFYYEKTSFGYQRYCHTAVNVDHNYNLQIIGKYC